MPAIARVVRGVPEQQFAIYCDNELVANVTTVAGIDEALTATEEAGFDPRVYVPGLHIAGLATAASTQWFIAWRGTGHEERHGPVEVRRVLESSVRMAWNEIRHRARLVKDYAAVPPVQANESRLGQVFLNLIVNAAQAIPEGRADHNEIRIATGMADGERVLVEVRDTGCGIAPEHMPRIFDAFFTTKPVGVGTGLGLAICHRIITSIGGDVSVQSEVGSGTTFRLLLPVATPVTPKSPEPTGLLAPSRRGRILVVDDEPMISASVRRMLGAEHDVVVVSRSADALERIATGEQFDVIVSDLMMPDMTGMELHAELCRVAPELAQRMVFMTGGAFTSGAREFLDRVPNPRLEKPFEATSLRFVIQSLLR